MKDKELIEEALRFEKRLENYNYASGDDHGHFRQKYREDIRRNDKEIIQRLVERVAELQSEPKSIVWEPEKGEEYWYISGSVLVGVCNRDNCSSYEVGFLTNERLKHHNVYKTQVQAEKAAKYQQRYNMVLQAVLNLEPDQVVDWKDKNQAKYGVAFDHIAGVWFYWGRCVLDKSFRSVLTDKKNVQPLLDYLNAKEKGDGSYKL